MTHCNTSSENAEHQSLWSNTPLVSGLDGVFVQYKVLRQKLIVTLSVVLYVLQITDKMFVFICDQTTSRHLDNVVPTQIIHR